MKIILFESQYKRIIEQRGGHNKVSFETWVTKSKENPKNRDINNEPYEYNKVKDYIDGSKHVSDIYCKVHNILFGAKTATAHMHGKAGCPECAKIKQEKPLLGKRKYSDEEIKHEAEKYKTDAEFKVESPKIYSAARKLDVKKGGTFYSEITSHFVPEDESAGENLIAKILMKHGLINDNCSSRKCSEREVKFEDCLSRKGVESTKITKCHELKFDFYLKKEKILIEYDGGQHFYPSKKFGGEEKFIETVAHDLIKNDYCSRHDINLIRIPDNLRGEEKIESELISVINNLKSNNIKGQRILLGNYPKKGWNG